MSHVFSITLDRKQIARLCEEYALSQHALRTQLSAKADVDIAQKNIIVRVSTKRERKASKEAEAKMAGERG